MSELGVIHSNQFMVIAMDKDSRDFKVKPTIYYSYQGALGDAQKFAQKTSHIKYIVVAVATVAETVENPVIVTKYKLD